LKSIKEKAYKVLAIQEKISNGEAKKLIDRGAVYLKGKRVNIARAEVPIETRFKVKKIERPKMIFEDDKILVVDKPVFLDSEEVAKFFGKDIFLLHRLDRDTSGLLLLGKDKDFQATVINEFKKQRVYKEYVAWVNGKIVEPITITKKLKKIQKGGGAKTVVAKDGLEATTHIEPLSISGSKTKVKAVIESGRTHQIRVHLSSIGFPIIGDKIYGGAEFERLLLHSKKMEFLDYSFEVQEPQIFGQFLR
jgi:23S rRNA pseudouridine1911/1915/1917 synthase